MQEIFLGDTWLLEISEGIKLYHDIAIPFRPEVEILILILTII